MYLNKELVIAKNSEKTIKILPNMLNRHGIITGATGTGKTISVKVLAETLSNAGIPVFITDVKGDVASICEEGEMNESISKRVEKLDLENFNVSSFPTRFFDVYGKTGHKVRARIDSFKASLLSRILELSDSQTGNLNIALKVAEDENLPVYNFVDLKDLLKYVMDNKDKYNSYGNITTQSIQTILRKLLEFENTDADIFFGEPELNLSDLCTYEGSTGRGIINILDSTELVKDYNLYSTLMLWLLNKIYDTFPEVGDLDKPKLVLFIDEAHLLFDDMNSSMLKKFTQIIKLIRSKGVGVFLISQSPSDIPEDILSQLGNRIQHNLKAYTPKELKSVKVAASSFRENPNLDTEKSIIELSTGEALVAFINELGQPEIVERAFILPPQSKIGVVDENVRRKIINLSNLRIKYDIDVDSISTHELLSKLKKEEPKKEEKKKKNQKSKTEKLIDRTINTATSTITRRVINKLFKGLFK